MGVATHVQREHLAGTPATRAGTQPKWNSQMSCSSRRPRTPLFQGGNTGSIPVHDARTRSVNSVARVRPCPGRSRGFDSRTGRQFPGGDSQVVEGISLQSCRAPSTARVRISLASPSFFSNQSVLATSRKEAPCSPDNSLCGHCARVPAACRHSPGASATRSCADAAVYRSPCTARPRWTLLSACERAANGEPLLPVASFNPACGAAWQRASFGKTRSQVRSLPRRPSVSGACGAVAALRNVDPVVVRFDSDHAPQPVIPPWRNWKTRRSQMPVPMGVSVRVGPRGPSTREGA